MSSDLNKEEYMEFYGSWNIQEIDSIGKCYINEKKSINLVLDDINRCVNVIPKIHGKTNEGNVILLNSHLTEIIPRKTQYFSEYAIFTKGIYSEEINLNSGFYSVKYKLKNLEKWLSIPKFKNLDLDERKADYIENKFEKNNLIELNNIEKIYLIDTSEIKVYIEYEKNLNKYLVEKEGNLNSFYYEPYIKIEYANEKRLFEIDTDVLMINRFFSLLIGFADEIPYYYVSNLTINSKVYSRFLFECNLGNKRGFEEKYFMEYELIKKNINSLFLSWKTLYEDKSYKLILDYYFSSNSSIIEDRYLLVCKALESMYNKENIIMDIDKQINTDVKVNEIKQILFHDPIIKKNMKDFIINNNLANKSKSAQDYINGVPRALLDYFCDKYLNKTTFGAKVEKFDEFQIYNNKFKENDVYTAGFNNIYDYTGQTRNYFTHLSKKENTFKDDKLIKYIMIMNLIFLNKLLEKIGLDENKRRIVILDNESYMMINIDYKTRRVIILIIQKV